MLIKVLMGLGGIFAAVIITVLILVVTIERGLSSEKGDHSETYPSKQAKAKKALIIYQPAAFSKITQRMAHQIALGLHDGGYDITVNYPGKHLPSDLSAYSVLVFGSPVYGGKISEALTTYLKRIEQVGNANIVLFSTGLNPKMPELEMMESALAQGKASETLKFLTKNKKDSEQIAYNLGQELSKN